MKTIQERLNEIDYKFEGYVPSVQAMRFAQFIKEVTGDGEENETPLIHMKMLDLIFDPNHRRKAIMAFRGSSKTTLSSEFGMLYAACFNEYLGLTDVNVGMYVAASLEKGAKDLRRNIEQRYMHSEFLHKMVPNKKFTATDTTSKYQMPLSDNDINDLHNAGRNITDARLEFVNIDGQPFCVRLFGVKTGIRGFKEYGKRPQIACHIKGTEVFTDLGMHKVENYYNKLGNRIEQGIEVELFGLTKKEIVTKEHKYWTASIIKTRKKDYLVPKGKTKTTASYKFIEPRWVEAKDLCFRKLLGNQQYRNDYIVKPIDYSIKDPMGFEYFQSMITKRNKKTGTIVKTKCKLIQKLHKHINHPSFWYLYGLYLSDGTTTKDKISFSFDSRKLLQIKVFKEHCKAIGYKYLKCKEYGNCVVYSINDSALSRYHKNNHLGNSIKFIPEWVLYQSLELQKQLLLGYINGDGYIDKKNNQIRINSVNEDAINKLGFICERLNLPYHIRMTRTKEFFQCMPNSGHFTICHKQWELRLSQNVKEVLGINIKSLPSDQVFILNGCLYRRFKSITLRQQLDEFIPITTPTHDYITQFGKSHNCLDDLITDQDARSDTVIATIEEVVYKAVTFALHPTNYCILWTGTPFNSKDPLYKAIESDAWKSIVLPVAEKFPCEKSEFVGAWEDRFPYDALKEKYDGAVVGGTEQAFRQELMLQIIPAEGLLVSQDKIVTIPTETFKEKNKNLYNFYITTDFAYTDKESSDYSVISVWAVNSNNEYILCDGYCGKQLMDRNIDTLFRFVQEYQPLQVGFELTGQQIGFVQILRNEMVKRNIFFNLQEIRPSRDKFSRFNLISPYFHQNKIMFLTHMMKSGWGTEFKDEISKATIEGFKSKHDDVLDTISQLMDLNIFAPSNQTELDKESLNEKRYDTKSNLVF